MRLADYFQIGTDTLALGPRSHLGLHAAHARVVAKHGWGGYSLLVHSNVDIQDDLLKDAELLLIFVHAHKFLQDLLWNEFIAELASDDGRAQVTDEFVFKLFFDEEAIDVLEKIVYLGDLQAEFYGDFDCDLIDGEIFLLSRLVRVVMHRVTLTCHTIIVLELEDYSLN